MPIKLDGKNLAENICIELKERCDFLKKKDIQPQLTVVTTSSDSANAIYIRNKFFKCKEIGIECWINKYHTLDLCSLKSLVKRKTPIIFQMPINLNKSLTMETLGSLVSDSEDVDGFIGPQNIISLAQGRNPINSPCTPKGIIRLLDEYKITIDGASVCLIGRSNIVGRPLAMMMEHRNATVTLCHSKTTPKALDNCICNSDIIVSATGNREVLKNYTDFTGKTIIDVGINRDINGKLCGDFQKEAYETAYAYTPVPGGVGPMTVAMLMENVIEFYEKKIQKERME